MQTTLTYLDSYCERAGHLGLWAEPLNALSNIAFLIVAWWTWQQIKTLRETAWRIWDIQLLSILIGFIGIGSGIWHFLPNSHTVLMDVIPILIFMNLFIFSACIRLLGWRFTQTLALWLVFMVINFISEFFVHRDLLNGTIMYVPGYFIFCFLVIMLWWKKSPATHMMLLALLLWSFSLILRTLDMMMCPIIPFGTHFIWHICNAMMMALLLCALIEQCVHARQSHR